MAFEVFILKGNKFPGGEAPDEIQLCRKGVIRLEGDETLFCNEASAKSVIAHFNDLTHDVVMDYEHATLIEGKEAPAAAWIYALEWRGDGEDGGLWAKLRWTPKAAKYVKDGEYRYHSPVFLADKTTGVIRLLYNVALTNQPKMKDVPDITAIAAKHILDKNGNVAGLAAKHTHLNQGDEEMKFSERLAKVLKLGADATEDQILQALKDLAESGETKDLELQALKDSTKGGSGLSLTVLKALGLEEGATDSDVLKGITALKASDAAAGDLGEQVVALKNEIAGMKGDSLVRKALKSGRLSPEEAKNWGNDMAASNPAQFDQVVMKRPAGSSVPLKDLDVKKDEPSDSVVTDDVQMSINKQMGIDPETFKKFGPKAEGEK